MPDFLGNFHIKDNFEPAGPINQVPAEWYNAVAKALNNLLVAPPLQLLKQQRMPWQLSITGSITGGGGTWTGLLVFKGVPVEDTPGDGYTIDVSVAANIEGIYFKVSVLTGAYSWADTIGADTDEYSYFWVADLVTEGTPNVYALNNHTQGDIRVERD